MSIQDLGSLGEFVGSIAVILTLLYFAIQLRQNTQAQKTNVRESMARAAQAGIMARAVNEEFSAVVFKANSNQPLDEFERFRVRNYAVAILRGFENNYLNYSDGLYTDEQWDGYRLLITSNLELSYFREAWEEMRPYATTSFTTEIDSIIRGMKKTADA